MVAKGVGGKNDDSLPGKHGRGRFVVDLVDLDTDEDDIQPQVRPARKA
jgi:hypothetical protein